MVILRCSCTASLFFHNLIVKELKRNSSHKEVAIMKSKNWKIGGAIILMALIGLMLVGCFSGPTAVISGPPGIVKPGEEVSFSGQFSRNSIVGYKWDIQPNALRVSGASGSVFQVIFPEGGEYMVSLTVTSANGFQDTDTFYLTVESTDPDPSVDEGFEIFILAESNGPECWPLTNGYDVRFRFVKVKGIGVGNENVPSVISPCHFPGKIEYFDDPDLRFFIDRGEVERSDDGDFWYKFYFSGMYHMAVYRGEELLCAGYVNVISKYSPHLP
jgi:hypothetical protein